MTHNITWQVFKITPILQFLLDRSYSAQLWIVPRFYLLIFVTGAVKDRCKTPDSPEGTRTTQQQPTSPQSSLSPRQLTNGCSSPVNNGSAESITPPLTAAAPLSVSLDTNPQQYNPGGASSCITRPLVKVKRFLSTLVQFGNDINTDVGERVRSLVLNLVVSYFTHSWWRGQPTWQTCILFQYH